MVSLPTRLAAAGLFSKWRKVAEKLVGGAACRYHRRRLGQRDTGVLGAVAAAARHMRAPARGSGGVGGGRHRRGLCKQIGGQRVLASLRRGGQVDGASAGSAWLGGRRGKGFKGSGCGLGGRGGKRVADSSCARWRGGVVRRSEGGEAAGGRWPCLDRLPARRPSGSQSPRGSPAGLPLDQGEPPAEGELAAAEPAVARGAGATSTLDSAEGSGAAEGLVGSGAGAGAGTGAGAGLAPGGGASLAPPMASAIAGFTRTCGGGGAGPDWGSGWVTGAAAGGSGWGTEPAPPAAHPSPQHAQPPHLLQALGAARLAGQLAQRGFAVLRGVGWGG